MAGGQATIYISGKSCLGTTDIFPGCESDFPMEPAAKTGGKGLTALTSYILIKEAFQGGVSDLTKQCAQNSSPKLNPTVDETLHFF